MPVCWLARLPKRGLLVIDDIVFGRGVDLVSEYLDGVAFEFVMLLPDFEVVKQRWVDMGSPFRVPLGLDRRRDLTQHAPPWLLA